jgi:hypothetical protein
MRVHIAYSNDLFNSEIHTHLLGHMHQKTKIAPLEKLFKFVTFGDSIAQNG